MAYYQSICGNNEAAAVFGQCYRLTCPLSQSFKGTVVRNDVKLEQQLTSTTMSVRPRLKKSQRALPTPTVDSYRLTPVATSATGNARRQKQGALVLLPNGVTLTQNPALPRLPGQFGLRGDRPVNLEDFASAAEESERPVTPLEGGFIDATELLSPSKHHSKRLRQWERWTTEILPLSVPAYLELQRSTEFLRKEAVVNVQGQACQCCLSPRKLTVWVIRFSSTSVVQSDMMIIKYSMLQGLSRSNSGLQIAQKPQFNLFVVAFSLVHQSIPLSQSMSVFWTLCDDSSSALHQITPPGVVQPLIFLLLRGIISRVTIL